MRFNDAITGAVLVVFAMAEIAYTRTFPSLHGQSYGPDLFPALIGVALTVCGLVLIVRGLLARREATIPETNIPETNIPETNIPETTGQATASNAMNNSTLRWIDSGNVTASKHARTNALLVIFFLLAYIFLSDWLGFIPLSLITVAVLLYRLGSSILIACSVAIITTAVIQILFAKVLLVPLPAGLLQGLVW